jgi:hypothetical protein
MRIAAHVRRARRCVSGYINSSRNITNMSYKTRTGACGESKKREPGSAYRRRGSRLTGHRARLGAMAGK